MNATLQKYLAGGAVLVAWTVLVVMHFLPAAPLQTAFEAALATLGGHASITSLYNLFAGALKQSGMGAQVVPSGTQVTFNPPVPVLNTAAPPSA
jgi:hypothetical protein